MLVISYRISKHLHKPCLYQLIQFSKLLFAKRNQIVHFSQNFVFAFLGINIWQVHNVIFQESFWHTFLTCASSHISLSLFAKSLPCGQIIQPFPRYFVCIRTQNMKFSASKADSVFHIMGDCTFSIFHTRCNFRK